MSDFPPPAPPSLQPPVGTQPTAAPRRDQPHYGAPFWDAFARFWKRYATFSGRASRAEFWWWMLVWVVADVVMFVTSLGGDTAFWITEVVRGIWIVATVVPFAALLWRRLHDANISGWWGLPFLALNLYSKLMAAIGLGQVPTSVIGSNIVSVVMGALMIHILVLGLRKPAPAGERFDKQQRA